MKEYKKPEIIKVDLEMEQTVMASSAAPSEIPGPPQP